MKAFIAVTLAIVAFSGPVAAHENAEAVKPKSATQQAQPAQLPEKTQAAQHSGGTDAAGCHTNHSTGVYHCHKPK